MTERIAIAVSALSLAISSLTAWLTLFRRGTVKMTRPMLIVFGSDAPRSGDDPRSPKVFLRTLLLATSKRGRIIESMYVTLSRNETQQNFNNWVYGERDQLVPGSGLFVGQTGVTVNHHFLAPRDSDFRFSEGEYRLSLFAGLLGDTTPKRLFTQHVSISRDLAALRANCPGASVYFEWEPQSGCYRPRVDKGRPRSDPADFLEMLGLPPDEAAERLR